MNLKMNKKKSKILKFISIFVVAISVISFIVYSESTATDKTAPSFDIEISKDKNITSIDDDITVTGIIKPNDFKKEIITKRIVFVLDVSLSMDESKSGKTTRIEKLKEATNKFLDQMKNVENVEVAIVAYSADAYINPIFSTQTGKISYTTRTGSKTTLNYYMAQESVRFFNTMENEGYKDLKKIVNGLKLSAGTNMAEGLRKGKYMLDYNDGPNIDKTVIFMSDGAPGFYSVNSKKGLYKIIDDKSIRGQGEPLLGATGSVTSIADPKDRYYVADYNNIEACKNAAVEIGKLYDGKANVYSLGYELDNTTIKISNPKVEKENYESGIIKEIHDSMVGENSTKKNEVYYAETDTIEKLFSDIAGNIKDEYRSEEIEITIDPTDGLLPNGEYAFYNNAGEVIEKPVIVYEGVTQGNKVVYSAEPIRFETKIKGTSIGNFKVNGNIHVKYPDLNYDEVINFNFNLQYGDRVPEIQAELISDKEVKAGPGEVVTIEYKIIPKEFKLEKNAEGNDDLYGTEKFTFDTKLKFNIGEKISIVNDGGLNKLDSASEGYDAETKIIPITYKLSEDGTYYPESSETIVSIKVKPMGFEETMTFGNPNSITYTGVYGQPMKYELETPSITLQRKTEIVHGFYDDVINDGVPVIDENTEGKVLMAGTIRKLAGTFTGYKGATASLSLDVNLNLNANSNINVYTIEGAEVKLYASINSSNFIIDSNGKKKYTIAMNDLTSDVNNMLIVYEVEVPQLRNDSDEGAKKYNSTIDYLGNSRIATIKTKGIEESPELF